MKTILLTLLLAGCASASQLPSVKGCGDVVYERHGASVTTTANCDVPGAHQSQLPAKQ